MNKSFIILVVAVIALGAGATVFFMKKTADAARTESDKILNDFKAIDESLQQSQKKYDSVLTGLKDSMQVK